MKRLREPDEPWRALHSPGAVADAVHAHLPEYGVVALEDLAAWHATCRVFARQWRREDYAEPLLRRALKEAQCWARTTCHAWYFVSACRLDCVLLMFAMARYVRERLVAVLETNPCTSPVHAFNRGTLRDAFLSTKETRVAPIGTEFTNGMMHLLALVDRYMRCRSGWRVFPGLYPPKSKPTMDDVFAVVPDCLATERVIDTYYAQHM